MSLEPSTVSPCLICANDVEALEVRWLWPGWVAFGKLTVLEGDPGQGKSALLVDLAARVSAGLRLPDGSPGVRANVCIASAEDGLADTIRPRLEAAGADLKRVQVLTGVWEGQGSHRPLELPGDLAALEELMGRGKCKLLILDPLTAYLGRGVDVRSDQDVRRCLHRLAVLAAGMGCAVVLVRHLKGWARVALYRGMGSVGIQAAARSGLVVAPDPDSPDHHVLACVKPNLSARPRSLRFRLSPAERGACRVEWCGGCDWTADDLLRPPERPEERGALAEACALLRDLLRDGRRPARECREEARAAGVTGRTLERAKQRLGARSERVGFGAAGEWFWLLPGGAEQGGPKLGDL
jgi:hypothetical protein